jgi:hypothetical protein
MKKYFSLVSFSLMGIGIGMPITLLCMTLIGGFNEVVKEFLVWTVASALFGILSGLFSGKSEKLSLPAVTVLHCVGCLSVATAACAICGYADSLVSLLKGIVPVFIIVYAVVYCLVFFAMKREEKAINEALSKE